MSVLEVCTRYILRQAYDTGWTETPAGTSVMLRVIRLLYRFVQPLIAVRVIKFDLVAFLLM